MPIPLEDNHGDILRKAMRGLGLNPADLAAAIKQPEVRIAQLLAPDPDEGLVKAAAAALGLGPQRLLRIARGTYHPQVTIPSTGFAMFSNTHGEGFVHFYLLWDEANRAAMAVDVGHDASEMLAMTKERGLQLTHVFITHAHGDHVFDLDRVIEKTGATAYAGTGEQLEGCAPVRAGQEFEVGSIIVQTRSTRGHARDAITYVVDRQPIPVAFVGDALFAGSIGGPSVSYQEALETNRSALFTLPDRTLVCPGHGPLTTIGQEKRNNPFFPEFAAEDELRDSP